MAITVNAKSYIADGFFGNTVSYIGPGQSGAAKDRLVLKKTDPKATPDFSGVNRYEAKFTRTVTLTGAKTATGEAWKRVEIVTPVGMSDADRDALIGDDAVWEATAGFKAMVKVGQVNG